MCTLEFADAVATQCLIGLGSKLRRTSTRCADELAFVANLLLITCGRTTRALHTPLLDGRPLKWPSLHAHAIKGWITLSYTFDIASRRSYLPLAQAPRRFTKCLTRFRYAPSFLTRLVSRLPSSVLRLLGSFSKVSWHVEEVTYIGSGNP